MVPTLDGAKIIKRSDLLDHVLMLVSWHAVLVPTT